MFADSQNGRLSARPTGPVLDAHVVFPGTVGRGARHAIDFSHRPQVKTGEAKSFSNEDEACLSWLFRRAGLDSCYYRPEGLQRRIPGLLRALRVRSLPEARAAVERDSYLAAEALGSLVLGVTHFFRDEEVFDLLRDRVLPDLVGPGSDARIWSVGCSDGSELYSLAIILAEQGTLHRRSLLGTDCRVAATACAAAGLYDPNSLRTVPAPWLRRYFNSLSRHWQVVPWLRAILQWRTADVLAIAEPGPWDMILCRNLAIYLQPATAAILWSRLHSALRPGGVLVTGKAERPPANLGFAAIGPCVYRRQRS